MTKLNLTSTYGSTHNPIDIDHINNIGYFFHISEVGGFSGTSPKSLLGNPSDYILIGMDYSEYNLTFYGVQIAFSFNYNKIAMRVCNYRSAGSSTWDSWAIVASN